MTHCLWVTAMLSQACVEIAMVTDTMVLQWAQGQHQAATPLPLGQTRAGPELAATLWSPSSATFSEIPAWVPRAVTRLFSCSRHPSPLGFYS